MKRSACGLLLGAVSVAAIAAQGPAEIVEAYHKALAGSDPKAVLAFTRDMEFAAKTKREVQSQQASADSSLAWVETLTRTQGTYEGDKVDLSGAETVVLRKDGGDWKIVHVHRSAHATRPPAAKKK
jgi:hypothetical protein